MKKPPPSGGWAETEGAQVVTYLWLLHIVIGFT
jgi:hypothetical protein